MKTKTQLEKEIEELEREYSESAERNQVSKEIVAIKLNQARATLTQTNAIIELIEKHIVEDDYMGIDTKQSLKELLTKIKGEEK